MEQKEFLEKQQKLFPEIAEFLLRCFDSFEEFESNVEWINRQGAGCGHGIAFTVGDGFALFMLERLEQKFFNQIVALAGLSEELEKSFHREDTLKQIAKVIAVTYLPYATHLERRKRVSRSVNELLKLLILLDKDIRGSIRNSIPVDVFVGKETVILTLTIKAVVNMFINVLAQEYAQIKEKNHETN